MRTDISLEIIMYLEDIKLRLEDYKNLRIQLSKEENKRLVKIKNPTEHIKYLFERLDKQNKLKNKFRKYLNAPKSNIKVEDVLEPIRVELDNKN